MRWLCACLAAPPTVSLAAVPSSLLMPNPDADCQLATQWLDNRKRRLRGWLLAHRRFGPMIGDWEREGAVSRRAKRLAMLMMALCAGVMFLTAPKWWMAASGTAIMACVALWLWRRPEPRQ